MPSLLTDSESIMWQLEADPSLWSDFTNVTLLGPSPDPGKLRARAASIVDAVPRLPRRVVPAPLRLGLPRWVDDPDFDLDYHLRHLRLPPPGSVRQLLDLAAGLASVPFDRDRPLWELTLVDGLADGRAALLQRMHHTITDGIGGMKLLGLLCDPDHGDGADADPKADGADAESEADGADAEPVAERTAGRTAVGTVASSLATLRPLGLLGSAGMALARRPTAVAEYARQALDAARSVRRQVLVGDGPRSALMTERAPLRRRFDVHSVPINRLRRASKALGGSRNDLFVGAVTGALDRYHRRKGVACDELRMAMAISTGNAGRDPGGNSFAPARLLVPLGPQDLAARVRRLQVCLSEAAAEPALTLADALAQVVALLPAPVLRPVFAGQARAVDFITSAVPGVRTGRRLAGAPVEASYPMGPRMGAAANITALSWGRQLHLGMNLDPAAMADPDEFLECVRDAFDEVLAVAE